MNPSPDLAGNNGQVDPNVASNLPTNSRVVSKTHHGTSFWATTGRITVSLPDNNTSQSYFIKTVTNDLGKSILYGEFESMKEIRKIVPDYAPRTIAWGTCKTAPDTHFLLCEYREMIHAKDQMPEPRAFTERLAKMHQGSCSANGKFGFHVPTYSGYLPQYTEWEESWEVFFAKTLRVALDLEIAAKGYDTGFETLVPAIFGRVIPRLLRPLESEGRTVKPALVHGDLWYGNSGTDKGTGGCLVFDACCFYAHHECEFYWLSTDRMQANRVDEFGQWRPVCNRFGEEYLAAYRSFVKPSPPEEDYDGRLDLYKLRFNTHVSALFKDDLPLRIQYVRVPFTRTSTNNLRMLNDMRDLIKRYG